MTAGPDAGRKDEAPGGARSDGRVGVVVIVGPTAAGKTALALRVARAFDGEVVGGDAFQIYRFMDIGTAKPTAEERASVPYHLVDVVEPDEPFDAFRYVALADSAIAEIRARARLPVVAGGTGLYVRCLVRGLAAMPGRDSELRKRLRDEAGREGPAALHRRLAAVDPEYAASVGERDLVRIVRALEVHAGTGRPLSEVHREHAARADRHRALWLGLDPGQRVLRDRIEQRTAAMFEAGFADEVRRLRAQGFGPDLPAMRALGYRHVHRLAAGQLDEREARRLTVRDTARYAKRQRTWFRGEQTVEWIDEKTYDVEGRVEAFLREGGG